MKLDSGISVEQVCAEFVKYGGARKHMKVAEDKEAVYKSYVQQHVCAVDIHFILGIF